MSHTASNVHDRGRISKSSCRVKMNPRRGWSIWQEVRRCDRKTIIPVMLSTT